MVALERRPGGATYEELAHLLSGHRGRDGLESGDVESGLICASQVIGLIDDVPSCAELVARMVADCRSCLAGALRTFDEETCHA